jgi:hypothetical protein
MGRIGLENLEARIFVVQNHTGFLHRFKTLASEYGSPWAKRQGIRAYFTTSAVRAV